MWFGTRDGLNRFDGNKFHIIKNQTKQRGTLISSWITDLAISPSGELWWVLIWEYKNTITKPILFP